MVYGAKHIAQALFDLDVKVIFGLPGLPVIDIAQEAMNLGIRFISFRNEQASVYAAAAYGYLTGKPGVCISVGGPGMLHVIAGVGRFLSRPIVGNSSEALLTGTTCDRQFMASTGTGRVQRDP